jgi:hypothetical protein
MEAGTGGVLPTQEHGTEDRSWVPMGPADLAGHYDLVFSHPRPDTPEYAAFDRWLAEAAARSDLSFALVHDGIVHEVVRRLGTRELTVGLHLGYETLWRWPDDPHVRLAFAVGDAGGQPINPPARARTFADRAVGSSELHRHDLGVTPAVLFRPWMAARPLTELERVRLRADEPGAVVRIMAAATPGHRGVVKVESTENEAIEAALVECRSHDPWDTYLIQRTFEPPFLESEGGGRPGRWRVLYCLGEITPFWWTPEGNTDAGYQEVTAGEAERLGLRPIYQFVQAQADLSGLDWFSTALALCPFPEPSRFAILGENGEEWPLVAVDFFNDQCEPDVRSRTPAALPDDFVQGLAWRLAELAWSLRQYAPAENLSFPEIRPLRSAA